MLLVVYVVVLSVDLSSIHKKVGENHELGIHFQGKADMLLIGLAKCFGAALGWQCLTQL